MLDYGKNAEDKLYRHEGNGFNNRSFLNKLDAIFPSILKYTQDFTFMVDNASIHTADMRQNGERLGNYADKCREHNVEYIKNWPSLSPGL